MKTRNLLRATGLLAGALAQTIAQPVIDLSNPIFTPRKHTKQSYAAQNRAAKRRRKVNAKRPK